MKRVDLDKASPLCDAIDKHSPSCHAIVEIDPWWVFGSRQIDDLEEGVLDALDLWERAPIGKEPLLIRER